ncbi:MAG: acriflavine resistance protein B [Deltaproteobacteria bacterium RIFOXYA12_FULL_58_15]|nr:MAG: acriflavine resistance protein B [Deltaproteobacteria bacterium RIFOXYA12_FULL_58_15]
MTFTEVFIRRPVATTLVTAGLLVFGSMAYRLLPVSDLPNVDFPTIQVSAGLPGASPETMAASVATPLEKEFTTIAGLDAMSSTSSQGYTQVTLQFNLERDLDAAAQDVQAAIARATRHLPADMPTPPSYSKVNPAASPILFIALTSPTLQLYELNEYGETMIAQRISTISGVAQVLVYGSQKYAVRIQMDPTLLAARGIGMDEVAAAVRQANVNLPTGGLKGTQRSFTIEASGNLDNAADYRSVIVSYRNGRPVRLEELGSVVDSVENDQTAAWFVDQRGLILAVQRQPGTNTVEVARAVKELLPTIRAQLPAAVDLQVLFDRSESIRDSVDDVKATLLIALVLVILVIFLFLRNLSSTVIPSLALPMALFGTFTVMWMLGYSLDNLSLMALTLSVGFVVDDAIVVLENIVRHMEMGKGPFRAAVEGAQEITSTVVSMTVSLAAVFIPVLFLGGIIGRLFQEFAVAIGAAVIISGFVSLSLTPMLASRFLRPNREEVHGKVYVWSENLFARALALYDRGLVWSLGHRRTVIAFTVLVQLATVALFVLVPKGFIPSEDTGQIFAFTEVAQGTSFDVLVAHQREAAAIVAADENVDAFMSSAGSRGGMGGTNAGMMFIHLKPRAERRLDADQVITKLRGKLSTLVGMRVFLQNPPTIRLGGRMSKSAYQLTLQSPDTEQLYGAAEQLYGKLLTLEQLRDVTSDLEMANPILDLDIDRDRATALGISAQQIEDVLYSAFGTRTVSTIYASNNTYSVILELDPQHQRDPAALDLLYVRSQRGDLVPLPTLVRISRRLGPLTVAHAGQLPAVTLSFNLKDGVALGDAVAAVERVTRATLPATVTSSFQGTAQAFQSSLQGLGMLLIISVLVIYMVLGILYESYVHPLTILSALPFAGFGALLTLLVFGTDLSIYAFVGIIMLVGLVKKNGIMMVDFAIEAQKQTRDATIAIREASRVRFRPIMMTTMAALFGTLPIALGLGAGAETRRPLGLAVVGGLLFSQMLTLFVTPVVYTYLDQFQGWLKKRRSAVVPDPDKRHRPK